MIQLCKNLFADQSYVLFVNNFFINAKLFKTLKIMNIKTCETTKIENEFFKQLIRLRTTITKKKHLKKISLMIIDDEKILYIT